jgi:hypothetical protein
MGRPSDFGASHRSEALWDPTYRSGRRRWQGAPQAPGCWHWKSGVERSRDPLSLDPLMALLKPQPLRWGTGVGSLALIVMFSLGALRCESDECKEDGAWIYTPCSAEDVNTLTCNACGSSIVTCIRDFPVEGPDTPISYEWRRVPFPCECLLPNNQIDTHCRYP